MSADRITVSVRLASDSLDPDDVSRELGVAPTFAARKGDRWSAGGREFTQRIGVWSIQFEGAPDAWTLDGAIAELLDRLPADLAVWARLATRHRIDLFCGFHLTSGKGGVSIKPELLRRMADRHLELELDIYSVQHDDDTDE